MQILILIGLSVFMGTLGAKFFQRLKIPQVTGYIVIGVLMGKSLLNIWDGDTIQALSPFSDLALGLIGFMIGAELKFEVFRNRGKSIYSVLFAEGLTAFVVVTVVVTMITHKLYYGLFLGAMAAATAPAATVDVLWEYKTRGPLTTTLLAIVALDDVLALMIYAFAGLFARGLILHEQFDVVEIMYVFQEIGIGVALGIVGGAILYSMIYFIKDRDRILPFSFGIIALTVGIASYFKLDLILSSMLVGMTLTNLAPVESDEIFDTVKRFSGPVYVLFFILVGARMDVALVFGSGLVVLVLGYVLSRTFGKMVGAYLGGRLSGAAPAVTKYLGLCLFSQAGVAIGLAISAQTNLSHFGPEAARIGETIVSVIVASTFIVQLIGPVCVRLAVARAGEIGRNVTEEDIMNLYAVGDMVESEVPVIRDNTPLHSMVGLMKESDSYDFCVVDHQNRLIGTISIGDLRDVLLTQENELWQLVLAKDIAVPAARVIGANRPLKDAVDILRRRDLDFLPVVQDEKTRELVGLLHYRFAMSEIQKQLLSRRKD